MPTNLYIAPVHRGSGRSLVALGFMEFLSRRTARLGFFRPVIDSEDPRVEPLYMMARRYRLALPPEALYGMTLEEARRRFVAGQSEAVVKDILAKFKEVERACDAVLVEGAEIGQDSSIAFDFNADLANHFGCAVVAVARCPADEGAALGVVRAARESFSRRGCTLLATFLNRVPPGESGCFAQGARGETRVGETVYMLPEDPLIGSPTVDEVARAIGAEVLHGTPESLQAACLTIRVAAMELSNFLPRLAEGALIVVPGDRADILVGTAASALSSGCPRIAGMVLTGGLRPSESVEKLIRGLGVPAFPILAVRDDTYQTATRIHGVQASLASGGERKIAAALGLFEKHVSLEGIERRLAIARPSRTTPLMFEYELIRRAKAAKRRIVLPEGEEERILRAADLLIRRGVVEITLLGDPEVIRRKAGTLGLEIGGADIVDPVKSEWRAEFAGIYHELRKHKGVTPEASADTVTDVSYFGTLMVHTGRAHGMVSGSVHTTQHTIRPAFEIVKTVPGCPIVSSVFFMCLADRVLVYGDCAVNPNPDAEHLAHIAMSSADTARQFGVEPVVAMLSYSTGESGKGEDVERVRQATAIARKLRPDLQIEGPIQYDAAVDPSVAKVKMPDSPVAGRATVLIFPDLNTGNNTYKAVQRSSGAVAIGPVLQGLRKPVNDLSRGCTVADIFNTVAITAVQAGKA